MGDDVANFNDNHDVDCDDDDDGEYDKYDDDF